MKEKKVKEWMKTGERGREWMRTGERVNERESGLESDRWKRG